MNSGNPTPISVKIILLIAFLEGFSVMAVELLGGKILSSYFGASHIMWIVILGITMLSLAIGYYIGGKISEKGNLRNALFNIMILVGVLVGFMVITANSIFSFFSNSNIYLGLIFSSLLLILPSLLCLGSITSILIQSINQDIGNSGNSSGKIYGFSTLGGIAGTFIIGFFVIPAIGVGYPLLLVSLLLLICAFAFLFSKAKKIIGMAAIVVYVVSFSIAKKNLEKKKSDFFKITYESEGVLGQIKVLDGKVLNQPYPTRRLLINGIPQTYIVNEASAYSLWLYPHFISTYATMKDSSSSVLLIGFGGGSVARELKNLKFNFEVVELDKRIMMLAKKYFYFDTDKINYTIDDARHFIKKTNKKYDLIIYDVLSGEAQPNYVFTSESLKELKTVLNPGAMIIINYQGILNDPEDKAFLSLYKTFENSGFNTYYWATNPDAFDDIVFVISPDPVDFKRIDEKRLNDCCKSSHAIGQFLKKPASKVSSSLENIELLTDDKPILDQLNRNAMLNWRQTMLKDITKAELDAGVSIFK